MGKKRKIEIPSVEKMSFLGFQDGYFGKKSCEESYLNRFIKKGLNNEQIKNRIVAYCLGYKKAQYISQKGANNCETINGEIVIDGKSIALNDGEEQRIETKISELEIRKAKKKGK